MGTEMVTCPSCGNSVPKSGRFCPECGFALTTLNSAIAAIAAGENAPVGSTSGTPASDTLAAPVERPSFEQEVERAGVEAPTAGIPPADTASTGGPNDDLTSGGGFRLSEPTPGPETPDAASGTSGVGVSSGEDASSTVNLSGGYQPPAYQTTPMPQYSYTPPAAPQPQYTPPAPAPTQYGQPTQAINNMPVAGQVQPPATTNYGGYNAPQAPMGYGYTTAPPRDPTIGLLLELLGYVGFLGIGHIWAGKTTRGIALLIGWWFYAAIAGVLTIVLIGCVMFLAWPIVPIVSGLYLKNELEKEQGMGGYRR